MASRLFKQAPNDMTLEELRDEMSTMVSLQEKERIKAAEVAHEDKKSYIIYAKIHVGSMLVDPRDKSESFLVSYSDADGEAARMIDGIIVRTEHTNKEVQEFYAQRDPFLGHLLS